MRLRCGLTLTGIRFEVRSYENMYDLDCARGLAASS